MRASLIEGFFVCPACRAPGLRVVPLEEGAGGLRNAVITCPSCRQWYRLEDGVLEMLMPGLRDERRARSFAGRFRSRWDGWNAAGATPAVEPPPPDAHKLGQKSFFDDEAIRYETQMVRLPFWRAFDATYVAAVGEGARDGGALVELGGGTGRMSLPILDRFSLVLSFDISETMVRRGVQNCDAQGPRAAHVHFFVADAENIPLQDGVADVASLSGILHHVSAPDRVLREAARVLKPGGRVIGNENNRSVMRFLFDRLMKVSELWREKAHHEHFIIHTDELQGWLRGAGLEARTWTSVFLPPHLFNVLGSTRALSFLRGTDALAHAVPWVRGQGGLVLYSGAKRAA